MSFHGTKKVRDKTCVYCNHDGAKSAHTWEQVIFVLSGIAGTRGQEAEATTTTTAAAAGAVTTTTAAAAAENAEETPVAGEVYLCWKIYFDIRIRQIYFNISVRQIYFNISVLKTNMFQHQWEVKILCWKLCFNFSFFRRHSRHKWDGCKLNIVFMKINQQSTDISPTIKPT